MGFKKWDAVCFKDGHEMYWDVVKVNWRTLTVETNEWWEKETHRVDASDCDYID